MKRTERIHHLADLLAQYTRALALMEQITHEAELQADWLFLDARVRELQKRVVVLCDDTQLRLMERAGYGIKERHERQESAVGAA